MHGLGFQASYDSFNEALCSVSNDINDANFVSQSKNHAYVTSPRGMKIKELLLAGYEITDPRNRLVTAPARKFSSEYFAAELVWYLVGDNSAEWISRHASFWNHIKNPDGTLNSAYGDRIFNRGVEFRNQWQMVVDELMKDPDSRRAVIHIRDIQDTFDKPDVPCTLTLQFFIRYKKLHMISHMRSNDLILGACYDVPIFTVLQEVMSNDLRVELGSYMHMANSLHVYEKHFDMVEKLACEPADELTPTPMVPLEKYADINAVRSDARKIFEFDKKLANFDIFEYLEDLDKSVFGFEDLLSSLSVSLMCDCARLIMTSYLRRTISRCTNLLPESINDLIDLRNRYLSKIEDQILAETALKIS